jgi:diguanylate cyclase (GGDEF)-like protein
VDIFDVQYRAFYLPLLDANGEVFAAFFVGAPLEQLKAASNALVQNITVISCLGVTLAVTLLFGVISTISRPLVELARDMDRIEEGSLDVVVEGYSGDEIGRAGKSLKKMLDTVHKLIDDINATISEHEKGNMDYQLDTEAFRGAYRLLVDRIIELSTLGMRDQLTGLPNRRSFDRRLDSEWKRAIREKHPLSFLIMDIDKFKVYNDTYGHQQGDVVLQTVAKTLPAPIRRVIDFAARWGGEEFVILRPPTDSEGAMHVAEMVRLAVESTEIPSLDGGQAKKVTISIGVSTQRPTPEGTIADLIAHADEALYQAKETGRNRVCRA